MKIILPHRTLRLTEKDKMMSDKDKVKKVNSVLQELIFVNGEEIPLDLYFTESFDNRSTIVALDMLSYFITKEHRVRQNIMTRETIGKMQRGDGRTVNFSNLSYIEMLALGMAEEDDFSSR